MATPVALHRHWATIPVAHVELLAGAAAIGSVFAELFMIKSLLVFDPKDPVEGEEGPLSPRYTKSRVSFIFLTIIPCYLPLTSYDGLHAPLTSQLQPDPLLGRQ